MPTNEQRRPAKGGAAVSSSASRHRLDTITRASRHLDSLLDELIAARDDLEAGRSITSHHRLATVVADLAAVRAGLQQGARP